jgi:hypothetical protein
VVKLPLILKRSETATGDHRQATAEKNVFKSHEPVVNTRDLVAYALRE